MNCLALAFRYKPIAVASVLCVVLNIVMLLLITKVFFGDQLHPAHWAGIGLGLLAIVVLELAQ
jgi:multidrug transporter EmrE-like cation transporter